MSSQEITLKFTGDPSLLKGALNEVKAQHASAMAEVTRQQRAEAQAAISLQRQRSSALVASWKADTRAAINEQQIRTKAAIQEEKQLAAQMIREARAAQTVRAQAERTLVADMRRMERERRQIAAENARAIAAVAKSEADARIREGRRASGTLVQINRAGGGGAGSGGGGFFGGSLLGFAGASPAVSAIGVGLGLSIFALTTQVTQGAAAWVNYASKLESTRIAFTTMLGSSQRAEDHLKELQAFAVKTPFQFEELIDASQRMQALGFEAEQVIPILTDVGNAVAAAGGGAERLDRVTLALSQMQSKGRVATQEMNQLAEAGIPGWRILEQQLGKSRAELVKMVEQGEISSKVFLEAFQKFSRQNFGGLMEKQAKTFTGAMSNIKDAALLTATTALAPLFEQMTKVTLELGRMGIGFTEAAQGAAALTRTVQALGGVVTGLGNIPLPEIFKNLPLLQGLRSVGGLLGLAGSPEIAPISGTGEATKPVPLRSSEEFADTEQANALRVQSEEAKRIATDRIAQQEQLFKLGKITREQETENIIAQLKIRALAEKQALDEEIIRKQQELSVNRDNAEKVKTIIEQIGILNQQIKNNQSAVDREIANKRTELQVQERRNLLQHQEARLAILLKTGEAEIAAVEAEVQAGIRSRQEGITKIEQIENAGFDARGRLLKLELAQASVEPSERQKINDKIEALNIERTANEQKQAQRRREIAKQEQANELAVEQQLARVREAQRQGELERIDYLLGRQAIMESTAIARRIAIEREAHEEEMLLIDLELQQTTVSAERKIELDNKKLESEQKYTDAHKILTQQRIDALNAEHAAQLNQRVSEVSPELIAAQAGIAANVAAGLPPEASIQMLITAALQAEGAFAGLGQAISGVLGLGAEAGQIFGQVLTTAFSGLAHAVGEAVHAFVLFGGAGVGLRKLAATMIAEIARMAAVQAVWELAQGFAMLALNFFWPDPKIAASAAAHFHAAAIYGGMAVLAAGAGRLVAGNAFQSTTGSGAGGGNQGRNPSDKGASGEIKPTDVDRRTVSSFQSQPIVQVIEYRIKGGVVADEFANDYLLNGRTRIIIKSDGLG